MQILSSNHAHIHLREHITHTFQCEDNRMMLRAWLRFEKKRSLSCNVVCLCRQAAEKIGAILLDKGAFAPTLLQPAVFLTPNFQVLGSWVSSQTQLYWLPMVSISTNATSYNASNWVVIKYWLYYNNAFNWLGWKVECLFKWLSCS